MFDLGWLELLVIGVTALIVVGPKDLPGMFRTVGRFMGKARGMAREFTRAMEQAADESGVKDAAGALKDVDDLGLNSATKSARDYAKNFVTQADEKKATETKAATEAAPETKPDTPDQKPAA